MGRRNLTTIKITLYEFWELNLSKKKKKNKRSMFSRIRSRVARKKQKLVSEFRTEDTDTETTETPETTATTEITETTATTENKDNPLETDLTFTDEFSEEENINASSSPFE